jgi:hypothetical protein
MRVTHTARTIVLGILMMLGALTSVGSAAASGSQRIGGRVVDDAGQPIAGAHVELWIRGNDPSGRDRLSRNTSTKTDKDGNWSLEGVAKDDAKVNVGVWDYHHSNGEYYEMKEMPAAQLRDGTFTVTLARGQEIQCVVLKDDGTPLVGAKVKFGGTFASNTIPAQFTDHDGRVVYVAKTGESVVLTAMARGYAPELTQFVMGADKRDVSMKLQKSTPLVGRVVDSDGKPVPDAWIYPDTWRGVRPFEERIQANGKGEFVWNDPPMDDVLCDVDATESGFIRLQNVRMSVADPETVVTVQRALQVSGTVVDADTNQPIESFRIIHGLAFGKDQPVNWQRQQPDKGRGGKFTASERWAYPFYAVRIEADGYLPADSRLYTADEKKVALDMKLKKGQPIAAVVFLPDGKPAVGAKAWLLGAGENLQISNGRETYNRDLPQATAGADGRCMFPPCAGAFKIVALSEAGYAELDSAGFSKSNEVHLVAWGQIHGKLMKGSKPWPDQKISVQILNPQIQRAVDFRMQPRVLQQIQATTDAAGMFAFDRVPSGTIQIGRYVEQQIGNMRWGASSQSEKIDIAAGQNIDVTIGGQGQPVGGKIAIPAALASRHDWIWGMKNTVREKGNPRVVGGLGGFLSRLASTGPASRPTEQPFLRSYVLEIGPDGKFRVDDVLPGNYVLSVNPISSVTGNGNGLNPNDRLAIGSAEFTIPELPGGRSDVALELPDVQMHILPRVAVGEPSPDFGAKTVDGKDVKISDFKGKFVLVEMFTDRMEAEANNVQALKSAAATFSGDERFCMLGVDCLATSESMKKYSQSNGLTWTMATVDRRGSEMSGPSRSLPSIWLVGPDGKVVAKDLHGESINAALTAALGPQGM